MLGAAAAAVGVALSFSTGAASTVPPGMTCPCVLNDAPATSGVCLRLVPGSGVQRCQVTKCDASWECTTDALSTHQCRSTGVTEVPECTGSVVRNMCGCTLKSVPQRSVLSPYQLNPQQRSRRGPADASPTAVPTPVWTPKGDMPFAQPMAPTCITDNIAISVEGRHVLCVKPINIGRRSIQAAYRHVGFTMTGWGTFNDFANIGFVRDAANRMYMCLTLGAGTRPSGTGDRHARSTFYSKSNDTTWYVQDDPTVKNPRDRYTTGKKGDYYALSATNTWSEATSDGWCAASSSSMVLNISHMTKMYGLAFLKGNVTAPKSGGGKAFLLSTAARMYNERWTIGSKFRHGSALAGRSLPTGSQNPRVYNIRMTPMCQCPQ